MLLANGDTSDYLRSPRIRVRASYSPREEELVDFFDGGDNVHI